MRLFQVGSEDVALIHEAIKGQSDVGGQGGEVKPSPNWEEEDAAEARAPLACPSISSGQQTSEYASCEAPNCPRTWNGHVARVE